MNERPVLDSKMRVPEGSNGWKADIGGTSLGVRLWLLADRLPHLLTSVATAKTTDRSRP